MKIISAHIENFGRLKDFDIKFSEGCTRVQGYNGWGKSTLAAFIRVMLYGFEGESKRSAPDNERKRWAPWQGGVYGGSLTFSHEGNLYTVTRQFGSKAIDDTFELRDAITNLVSNDYSSKLGEEILQVNSESYMRTAFIGQNDVVTSTTDGINSKIGNIADNTNDLDCFEKASGRLADILNKKSPKRATGSIYKLKNEVLSLQTSIRDGSNIPNSMIKLDESIKLRDDELKERELKKLALLKEQKKVSEYKDVQTILDIHEKISEDAKEREEHVEELAKAFPAGIPDVDALKQKLEEANKLNGITDSLDMYKISGDELIDIENLTLVYEKEPVNVEEATALIKKWRERERRAIEESSRQSELKMLKNQAEAEKREGKSLPMSAITGLIIIVIAMAVAIASVVLLPSIKLIAIALGVAAVLLITGIVLTVLKLKAHNKEIGDRIEAYNKDMAKLSDLIAEDIYFRNEVDNSVSHFVTKYGRRFSTSTAADDLIQIQSQYVDYENLLRKKNAYEEVAQKHNKLDEELRDYMISLGVASQGDYSAELSKMLVDINTYSEAKKVADAAVNAKEKYEEEHDIKKLKGLITEEEVKDLAVLANEIDDINVRIDAIKEELRELSRQQSGLQEKLNVWEEHREILSQWEKNLYEEEKSYKYVQSAQKYLTEAKEAMTAKYMEPLLNGFAKYYGAITGKEANRYHIDANTNISVEEKGAQRDPRMFSAGYQDLIGFCMRLSLVDAMYPDDKPVLVLDDPFVNLDTERMEAANKLLKVLSKDYQIIYFTCH